MTTTDDEPIWSRHFARKMAESLGFRLSDEPGKSGFVELTPQADQLLQRLIEALRYLPNVQWNCTFNFAEFLRTQQIEGCPPAHLPGNALQVLEEVCLLAEYLRSRHGTPLPADEKDYWTREDEIDFSNACLRRLEEEDPWPKDDYPN